MGEPPDAINSEVDSNNRLRRMYYEAAPAAYRRFRFGHAVAASACVPGLFEPLALPDLYPELTVRLVDGGVHDNQGVAGLLEQGMNVFLVSDASGQMELQRQPASSLLGVPLRANSILMARVREAEFRELNARRRSLLLRGLMFLHLKKDLETEALDWIGCTQPYDASEDARPPEQRGQLTSYGVSKEVQQKLAALRTDLDSFSDAEAYALMASGYRMTAHEYSAGIRHFQRKPADAGVPWKFLEIEKFTSRTPGRESGEQALMKILHVGSQHALKVWQLSPNLQALGLLLCAAGALWLILLALKFSDTALLTVGMLSGALFAFAVAAVFGKIGMRVTNFRDELKRIAKGVALSLGGWLVAGIHLWIFDPLYLSYGRLSTLEQQKRGGSGRRIGTLLVVIIVALVFLTVWLPRTDSWQKMRMISQAPVVQVLATREVGVEHVADWAAALDRVGEREKAAEIWNRITVFLPSLTDEEEIVKALTGFAEGLAAAGKMELARERLDAARKNAAKIKDPESAARALVECAKVAAKLGDSTLAITLAEAAAAAISGPATPRLAQARIALALASAGSSDAAVKVALLVAESAPPQEISAEWVRAYAVAVRALALAQQLPRARKLLPVLDGYLEKAGGGRPPPELVADVAQAEAAAGEIDPKSPIASVSQLPGVAVAVAQELIRAGRDEEALLRNTAIKDPGTRAAADLLVAEARARSGDFTAARKICERQLPAVQGLSDEVAKSALLSKIAGIYATCGDVRTGRLVADDCSLAADRLRAYTALLRVLPPQK